MDAGAGTQCKVFEPSDACGDLSCKEFLGVAGCKCPDVTGHTRYVDGVDGTFLDGGPGPSDGGHVAPPTGADAPAQCRFRTFGDALAVSGVTHVTATTDIPRWQSVTSYQAGDRVRPSSDNGSYYRATQHGVSGLTEPTWLNDGGVTADDGVSWEEAGAFVYADEALPLRVQSGQTLDTSACPAGTATLCSPLLAVVANTAAGVSPAIQLEAGGTLSGVAVYQAAGGGTDGVACNSAGTATLENTWVLGNERLANCFAARSGCGLDGGGVVAGGCRSGLLVTGSGSTHLTGAILGTSAALGGPFGDLPNEVGVRSSPGSSGALVLDQCIVAGNDAGVEVSGDTTLFGCTVAYNHTVGVYQLGASLSVADGGIRFNGGSGLSVEGGVIDLLHQQVAHNGGNGVNLGANQSTVIANLRRSEISQNGGTGIGVQNHHEATLTFTDLDIFGNGTSVAGTQDAAGILLDNQGSFTSGGFRNNLIHGNTGAQIRITRDAAGGAHWNLNGNACSGTSARPNAVYCYSGSGDSLGIVNDTATQVEAVYFFWANDPPKQAPAVPLAPPYDYSGPVNTVSSGGTNGCGAYDGGC